MISTYMDDFLIAAKKGKELNIFKKELAKELDIEDLGEAAYFLGVRIVYD